MASISLDLRERILKALQEDSSSLRVAARFSVSASFVRKLRIQVRRTGNARAGKAPGKERLVSGPKERKLRELVDKHPDATLVELAKLLERSARLSVSETTMWRSLRRLGLTRKKRASVRANARARM
jgi:transposase